MHVCLDIQSALAQRAGVGRYTRMLAEHLARQRGGDELRLFYFDFKRRGCDFAPPGVPSRGITWIPGRVVQGAWKTLSFPPFDWFSGPADVFHFPNFIRPPLRRGRSVVTIHDASFLRHPETLETKNFQYLTRKIHATVEQADLILCISAFTARELEERLGVAPSKLRVTHLGVSPDYRRASDEQRQSLRKRLHLDRPYLLSVGTLEPRKNLSFLVEVFEQLDFDGDLVLAGMTGWKAESLLKRIASSSRRDRIRRLDYVAEEDLPALYSGAELFVTPSLYEGFGFTPLESMQCGTPVLAAATGSLPEVLGEAAGLVEGFDAAEWKARIEHALGDPAWRREQSAKGLARAAGYTWEKTARQTWDVYRSLSA